MRPPPSRLHAVSDFSFQSTQNVCQIWDSVDIFYTYDETGCLLSERDMGNVASCQVPDDSVVLS
jgi:hypothetical protein